VRVGDDLDVSPWKMVGALVVAIVMWWLILSYLPWV
jgi:hypothetical protein